MKNCRDKNNSNKKDNKTFVGIILLVIGIALLGRNLNIIPFSLTHIIFSWPMLMIVFGLILLAGNGKSIGGLFMIGTGGIFLWNHLMPFSAFQWKIAWPFLFIFVGTALILIYLGSSIKNIIISDTKTQKSNFNKSKHKNVEFDIDKIEPIED